MNGSAQLDLEEPGRLASFSLMDWTAATSTVNDYHYDASNKMVLEERTTPGASLLQIFRFQGDRQEGGAVVTETLQEVLPMLRMENASDPKWVFHDVDQHALHVWNDVGFEESFEVSGVYGGRFDSPIAPQYYQGADWKIDGLHGGEVDRDLGIVHRGQRHSMIGDGRWFQAEPMLAAGTNNIDFMRPGSVSGVYAGGNPLAEADTSGFFLETAWDAANVVMGAVSLASNIKEGNYGSAAMDAAGLVLDVGAMVVPGVPGGAGAGLKAVRASAKAGDAVMAFKSAEKVVDLGGAAKKVVSGCTCFVKETEVLVSEGERGITEMAPGDEVIAQDPESEEDWVPIEELQVLLTCDPALDPNCVLSEEVPHE